MHAVLDAACLENSAQPRARTSFVPSRANAVGMTSADRRWWALALFP